MALNAHGQMITHSDTHVISSMDISMDNNPNGIWMGNLGSQLSIITVKKLKIETP